MSKAFQITTVALLVLIAALQLVSIFAGSPRLAVVRPGPAYTRANMASPDAYYDPCYLGTCGRYLPRVLDGHGEPCALDENGNPLPDGC